MAPSIPVHPSDNLERVAAALGIPPGAYHYEEAGPAHGRLVCHADPTIGPEVALRDERRRFDGAKDDPREVAEAMGLATGEWQVEGDEVVATNRLPAAAPQVPGEINTPDALRRAVTHAENAHADAQATVERAAAFVAELREADAPEDAIARAQIGEAEARGHLRKVEAALTADRAALTEVTRKA